jgi:thiamine-phosphate pyrophosphorylase
MNLRGLYFLTDSGLSKQGIVEDVKQVLNAGCKIVQYRNKEKSSKGMVQEASKLAKLCKEQNALFLVNDRLDIAQAVDANGVHLGQDDMPLNAARKILGSEKVIGITTHNLEEALQAEKDGADYVCVSPIFQTDTKKDAGEPTGIFLIKEVKQKVKIPVAAIGGINLENARQVITAGADSVCVISAIVCNENVEKAAKEIIEEIGG